MKFWPSRLWKAARITVETEQVTIIRRRRIAKFWCSQCMAESEFIPVEAVKQLLGGGLSERKLLPPGDGCHFNKAADGSTVVCVRSLPGHS